MINALIVDHCSMCENRMFACLAPNYDLYLSVYTQPHNAALNPYKVRKHSRLALVAYPSTPSMVSRHTRTMGPDCRCALLQMVQKNVLTIASAGGSMVSIGVMYTPPSFTAFGLRSYLTELYNCGIRAKSWEFIFHLSFSSPARAGHSHGCARGCCLSAA